MSFPDPETVAALQAEWTAKFVRLKPDQTQYGRAVGKVGRVITVNQSGRALVDFGDGAWYDIPASADVLDVVPDDEAKGKYDPAANSAQKNPPRQG